MAAARHRVLLALAIPVLVVVLLVAAWAIDTSQAERQGPAQRHAGRRGHRSPARGHSSPRRSSEVGEKYADTKVQVRVGAEDLRGPGRPSSASTLDENETIDSALDLDDDELVGQPPDHVAGLVRLRARGAAPLHGERRRSSSRAFAPWSAPRRSSPTEPKIVDTGDGFNLVSGATGRTIDPTGVREQLLARAETGELPDRRARPR